MNLTVIVIGKYPQKEASICPPERQLHVAVSTGGKSFLKVKLKKARIKSACGSRRSSEK